MLPQGGPAKQSPHSSCLVLNDDLRVISCHRTARQNGRAPTPGGHRPFRLTACKCDGGATIPVERVTAGGERCEGGGGGGGGGSFVAICNTIVCKLVCSPFSLFLFVCFLLL